MGWTVYRIIWTLLLTSVLTVWLAWKRYGVVIKSRPSTKNKEARLMIVLGSGGHTGEMFRLLKDVQLNSYHKRYWVYTKGDALSAEKAANYEHEKSLDSAELNSSSWSLLETPRARYVGQSYVSSIFTSLVSFWTSFQHVLQASPSVIVCNGPGTCVIICASAFMLNFVGISHTRIIYIESLARVHSLSLSGKLVRKISHRFIVQWPELAHKYVDSEYYGILV